jgi:hypothetical protein
MPETRGTESTLRAARAVAFVAAVGALVALLLGGSLLSVRPSTSVAGNAWLTAAIGAGAAALAALSVLDMFTVPALHLTLSRIGPRLIVLSTGCALTGDLLGLVGRLTQLAAQVSALRDSSAAPVLELLQHTINTGGFVLVAVSFTVFGILFVRRGSRVLGVIAIVAGVCTMVGQLPSLEPVFYLANVAFIAWYISLARLFHARRARP